MLDRPLIGVAVIIADRKKILLGKRKNSHGQGTWALPGGHLEFNETIYECAHREVFEETGLYIKDIRYGTFTNDIFTKERKHYVTLYVLARYDHGQLELKEPHKCETWQWFDLHNLPEPKFLSLNNLIKQGFLNPEIL